MLVLCLMNIKLMTAPKIKNEIMLVVSLMNNKLMTALSLMKIKQMLVRATITYLSLW
jgi:hypothetical protein